MIAAGGVDLLGDRLDGVGPEGDRRHEVAVHHVDVDHARARGEHLLDLRAEPAEVGCEDRRGDLARADALGVAQLRALRHSGLSMLPLQWLQTTIAVVDMRTIVECSPQLGQTDCSS